MHPVSLRAAENTASQRSSNTSSSGSVGISFGTDGFLVTGSASRGKGHADGDDTWYSNTHVTAGKTLNIHSGGDTILDGAVASGQKAKADLRGNLFRRPVPATAKIAPARPSASQISAKAQW